MMEFISPYCQITDGCQRPRLTNMEGCYTCEHEKRKAERDALKPVKKAKAIPKRSAKKVKEDGQYTVLKKKFLEEYPLCNAAVLGHCNNPAIEIHHTSLSSLNYLNAETWIGCCRSCHHYIETQMSAELRRKEGLLTD